MRVLVILFVHVIVVSEESLRRTLRSYFGYYHKSRTHLSLGKDAPEPRAAHNPELGKVIALPEVAVFTTVTNGEQLDFVLGNCCACWGEVR